MTHFKSTLATAFVALSGLVVAQQVLYPHVDEPPRPRVVVAQAAEAASAPAMTWVDPPTKPQVTAENAAPGEPKVEPAHSSATKTEAPVKATPTPPVRFASTAAEAPKKADAAKKRRSAQNAAHPRQLASRAVTTAEAAPETASAAQPAPKPRVDPIGDLLRGLGIGGQG